MIPFIVFQTLFLVISSTLIGALINHTFKLNLNRFFNLILGFIVILCIYYISGVVWVLNRFSTQSYYLLNFGLIGLLVILSVFRIKNYKFIQLRYGVLGILLVSLLMEIGRASCRGRV